MSAFRIAEVPEEFVRPAIEEIVASGGAIGELRSTLKSGLADLHLQFERLEQRLTQLEVLIGRQGNGLVAELDKQDDALQSRMGDLAVASRSEAMLTRWLAVFNLVVTLAILARLFGFLHI